MPKKLFEFLQQKNEFSQISQNIIHRVKVGVYVFDTFLRENNLLGSPQRGSMDSMGLGIGHWALGRNRDTIGIGIGIGIGIELHS